MAGGRIELVALTKRFTDIAVDRVDLTVDSGEFFSLLGPSGCGKTTTLRLIAGFEQPTEGTILLDGVEMTNTPPHRRNVNTVFQSYALSRSSRCSTTSPSGCATGTSRRRT